MSDRHSCCYRASNDGEESHAICNDDSDVPPPVGQQLRDGEGAELAIARAKAKELFKSVHVS